MSEILITGTVLAIDGSAWAYARVELRRVGEAVGEMPVVAVADSAGEFSVTIWTDETAVFSVIARLPDGSTFSIPVDPEEESVDATTLRAYKAAASQIENVTPDGRPLFGYSSGQNFTSATEVPITGCSVTVKDDTFYHVDIWLAVDDPSASPGEISTTGTATFTGLLLRKCFDANGNLSSAEDGRPATFETSGGGNVSAGILLHFSGTIQTTGAGTIILNALSINGPGDAFAIDEVRMTLTPIGKV